MRPIRTAILISGRGSNMQALLAAATAPDYPAAIVLVISNVADAGGLALALAAGVETVVVDHRGFAKDRRAHEEALDRVLRERSIQLVALAGYMRILTPYLTERWRGRMLNIHPSLLPRHPGLHTHKSAIEAGDAEAGCTVHLVTEGVDAGPILGQARVPIHPGDDEQALAGRVLQQEHRLYPACLARLASSLKDEADGRASGAP